MTQRRFALPRLLLRSMDRVFLSALLLGFFVTFAFVCGSTSTTAADTPPEKPIDFTRQVQPILAKRCYACHGPDKSEGGLKFTSKETAFAKAESGDFAIVPGDVKASMIVARISGDEHGDRMPPEGKPLSEDEIELITRWIGQGATWNKHWAFEPMKRHAVPQVDDKDWGKHPIDAFIFKSLADAHLSPNEPADRRTLIRRVYYDLTGLPPATAEVEQFEGDSDPLAFEKLIDRLLDSHHYGERWGRHWLDLVRYAETNSFERDNPKPNAWKYRDYVIKSFNDDKPYDQFVREQIAGDEVDEVTPETLTATGYYRLGIWDDEPADPLQARFDEMDDIIMTTGQAFLGLTINCARCHDHKIDPIPQADYYSLLAFMEDVTPWGSRGDQQSNNQIDVSSQELHARYAENDARQRVLEREIQEIEQAGIVKMTAADQRATEGPKKDRARVLKEKLRDQLSDEDWKSYQSLKKALNDMVQAGKQLPPRETVMGLGRYVPEPKKTFILYRGSPQAPADEVTPAFPTIFDDPPPSIPSVSDGKKDHSTSAGRRRILADWIANENNMLTARVIVNRIWQFHFGRGIVRSSNNFGQLGVPPTHPELLDWLAYRLIDDGWKMKSIHRLIMTSRAYQMSSAVREDASAVDPGNDLFWRFNPRRLSAEEVRDSVLAVNGTLNRQPYGPSFYPKLSAEVLAGQSRPGAGWGNSSEEDRSRRSVYIHVKRSLLTPLLTAFDFPDPDLTCEERFTTLQPGQALSMLNSEFIHKQAGKLVKSIDASSIEDGEVVKRTIRAVLAREATDAEIESGTELIAELESKHGIARGRALELYCMTVMNWNEFLFVD